MTQNKEMKNEILKKIKNSLQSEYKGMNSMGCDERYYDKHYLVGECFTEQELSNMNLGELENLLKLASYASDIFY